VELKGKPPLVGNSTKDSLLSGGVLLPKVFPHRVFSSFCLHLKEIFTTKNPFEGIAKEILPPMGWFFS